MMEGTVHDVRYSTSQRSAPHAAFGASEDLTFGKLPFGKLSLGKLPLGKYLTPSTLQYSTNLHDFKTNSYFRKDYEELPQLIKDDVSIHFAEEYKDVYNIAFSDSTSSRQTG